MLDIKYIRENSDKVKQALQSRGVEIDFKEFLKLDKERREIIQEEEKLNSKKNRLSKGKPSEQRIMESKEVGDELEKLKSQNSKVKLKFDKLLSNLPNIPQPEVTIGKDESENRVIKKIGKPTKFSFKPKNYLSLAYALDLIDVKRAAKVSGSRFGYLKNQAVYLQFALIQYALDLLKKEKFKLFITPALVKEEIMEKTGYDTYTEGQDAYYLAKDKLYLVGTGEHALIPYHADEVLNGKNLPLRYSTYSSCFRREAGSYGKDTKGIIRVHQFDKLEMVSFTTPDKSVKEFDFLLHLQEKLVHGLGLPYQLVEVCTGDLPKPSSKVIDLECFIPSENKYRETHSVSNCTDYQARLLNIKYKDKDNKEFVHTLNGTAFAIGRILIAIIENYQTKDGQIEVPKALRKYVDFKVIKKP